MIILLRKSFFELNGSVKELTKINIAYVILVMIYVVHFSSKRDLITNTFCVTNYIFIFNVLLMKESVRINVDFDE